MRPAAALALAALALAARAAVPVRWTVETSRPAVPVFDARHGETLDLRAAFTAGGEPLPIAPNAALCWQTNGMGDAWWTAPATVASNAVSATFTPEMDPGADTVSAFLGVPGDNWRAEFRLRLRRSPGAVPNALPVPPRTIDFATVEVANAPWATAADLEAATNGLLAAETDPDFRAWRTNTAAAVGFAASSGDRAVAIGFGASAGGARSVAIGQFAQARHAHSVAIGSEVYSRGDDTVCFAANPDNIWLDSVYHPGGGLGRTLQEYLDDKADADGVYSTTASDARFYPKAEGDLWSSWWSGDGFRVTVTNYDVGAEADVAWERLPSARFEYRPDGAAANGLRTVWDEETKWGRWRGEFAAHTNALAGALGGKAGLDWGRTTPTGFDAPAGFTWLDTPATVIAGGLGWQKTLTSEGAIWALVSNGMIAQIGSPGAATNGYLRITDERGEAVLEVVSGSGVPVGAAADSVRTRIGDDGRTYVGLVYAVESDQPPTLYAAPSLAPGGATEWTALGDEGCPALAEGWTGASGAWSNVVWRSEAPAPGETDQLYVYATYQRGGDTVIRHHAAVEVEKLVLGGRTYTLGTATIDGKTVLTLTEVE